MRTIKRDIAGVFIFSSDNKILLGYAGVYAGELVIPGGGVNEDETHEEAARREIFEETGVDLSETELEKLPGDNSGVSTKKLRDTGEMVTVEMKFFDYVARLDNEAKGVVINATDDLIDAKFYSAPELADKNICRSTRLRLVQIGFLAD